MEIIYSVDVKLSEKVKENHTVFVCLYNSEGKCITEQAGSNPGLASGSNSFLIAHLISFDVFISRKTSFTRRRDFAVPGLLRLSSECACTRENVFSRFLKFPNRSLVFQSLKPGGKELEFQFVFFLSLKNDEVLEF